MGGSESNAVIDHQGKVVMNRRCIVLVCPPSFQTSKFIDSKPQSLNYRYVSVGKLIRDEINKRTHYSKIIMENLTKYKKINDKILQVLLKNIALQGNFIIQFCPKDNDDLQIWQKFLKQLDIQLIAIIKPDQKLDLQQQKQLFEQKMKNYYRDVKNIKQLFDKDIVHSFDYFGNGQTWDAVIAKLKSNRVGNQHKTNS